MRWTGFVRWVRAHGRGGYVLVGVLVWMTGLVWAAAGGGTATALIGAALSALAAVTVGAASRNGASSGGAAPATASETQRPLEVREAEPDRKPVLWRVRTGVVDAPGQLAEVAAALAALGADIRTVQVHPTTEGAVDEILLHAPSGVRRRDLLRTVRVAGGTSVRVARAEVHELDDIPTRALRVATGLVTGRTELRRGLAVLLGEVAVDWCEPNVRIQEDQHTIAVPAPGGGMFRVHRSNGEFTPAEQARAQRLADLAARSWVRPPAHADVIGTRSGRELPTRVVDRSDYAHLLAFYRACSPASRHRRHRAGPPDQDEILRLLTPGVGRALAVFDGDDIIAWGNLVYEGEQGDVALLVRDDWQRRGIGTALARLLVDHAERVGLSAVSARTQVDDSPTAATLRAAGFILHRVPEPGEWHWTHTASEHAT